MFFIVHYFLICAFHIIFRIVDKTRFELVLLRLQHSTLPLSYLSNKMIKRFVLLACAKQRCVFRYIFCGEYQIRTDEAVTPCCLASSSLNRLSNSPFCVSDRIRTYLSLSRIGVTDRYNSPSLQHSHFICGNRKTRTFINRLTYDRSSFELYFLCWPDEIRTHNPRIKSSVHLTVELRANM